MSCREASLGCQNAEKSDGLNVFKFSSLALFLFSGTPPNCNTYPEPDRFQQQAGCEQTSFGSTCKTQLTCKSVKGSKWMYLKWTAFDVSLHPAKQLAKNIPFPESTLNSFETFRYVLLLAYTHCTIVYQQVSMLIRTASFKQSQLWRNQTSTSLLALGKACTRNHKIIPSEN